MKIYKLILTALTLTLSVAQAFAWGQKGHDVTANIAQQHLTPEAKAMVDSLLEGKSMVYWANWLDNASYQPEYAYTKTWHYRNTNAGVDYDAMSANPRGDVTRAITAMTDTLANPTASFAGKQLALKILIHLVGDLHQPMHMGHATDLGGNKVKVKFFKTDTNLHSVWDSNLVETGHKWSYSEWTDQIDRATPEQIEVITAGTVDDWGRESLAIASEIYEATPAGSALSYNEIAKAAPIIEQQLLRAGLRLASILNKSLTK